MAGFIVGIHSEKGGVARPITRLIEDAANPLAGLYVRFGPFSRCVVRRIDEEIAKIDAGGWVQPLSRSLETALVERLA